MEEIFKEIEGYNSYFISNLGRIKRIKNNKEISLKERIIKNKKHTNRILPYKRIVLYKNSIRKEFLIHRLVAVNFVDGYKDGLQVNHKDMDVGNNIFNNLEWVTAKENVNHSFKNNKNRNTSHCAEILNKYRKYGENKSNSKLTFKKATEIRQKYKPHIYPLKKLASEYNVSKKLILLIIQNKIWKNEKSN